MEKEYHDLRLDGYFAVKSVDRVLPLGEPFTFPWYGVLISLDSQLLLTKDEFPIPMKGGELICLSPGCVLELKEYDAKTNFFVLFNKEFYCIELHDKETSCNGLLFNGVITPPAIVLSEAETSKIALLLQVIEDEMDEADEVQGEMLRAVLKRLLILCARNYRKSLADDFQLNPEQTDLIRDFNALVEKHFKQHHRVGDYADLLFKSPKTLSNVFSKFSESTPLQIIHDRLVLEGKRLLHYTEKTTREIAFELGFDEPSHFTRLFKKVTGTTPSQVKSGQKKS